MSSKRLSKDVRKSQIQHAAKEIILKKGFFNTTMDDVIVCSGMSVGGVYHYYKNVYEIFYDTMSQGLDYGEERSFLKAGERHDLDTFVDFMMAKIFDDNDYKELFAILLEGIARDQKLLRIYKKLNIKYIDILHRAFRDSGISKDILEDRFLIFFTHSLLIGYASFKPLGGKESFQKNKDIVKKMILLYLNECQGRKNK
ncbi:TetR/AcrR family transcriptional regulator [Pseudoramibacter alactolyticus]|uniref:TetR/AcrR family transcriptional regulator n=1 Tax=Pseudoramibacter alactolyticus TaxID=113287 RepID=UPI0023549029|nr:TetR/AcrR family transcriptional regulator [Pseudoramibacter alactolyticus]